MNLDIPEEISYTESDVNDTLAKTVLREGWYGFRVIKADRKVSATSGNLRISNKVAPLKDVDNDDSIVAYLGVFHQLVLPIPNPNIEGHKKPKTTGFCLNFLRAVGFDIPLHPHREDGEWEYDGDPIEVGEINECKKRTNALVLAACKEVWSDPSQLEGRVFFAKAIHNGDFVNLQSGQMQPEMPEDEELVDSEDFEDSVIPGGVSNGTGGSTESI